jgi:LmbE family N-acetylglucosaminyl deacetylase
VSKLTALAIVAHPDDIEFSMAGTLLLLKEGGAEIHFWNLANGCYGSMVHSRSEITGIRAEEARPRRSEQAPLFIHRSPTISASSIRQS